MATPPENTLFDPRWLTAPPVRVFKDDGRSRVWLIGTPAGAMVVKRFERPALRQVVTWFVGCHPVQVEARRVRDLQRAGLPVPPVVHRGRWPAGVRWYLVYPHAGKSLLWRLRDGDLANRAARQRVIDALARAIADLLAAGWVHTDLKTTNVLLDDAGKLWLIDAGAVERLRAGAAGREQTAHMLATLDAGARKDRVSRTDRLRLLRRVVELRPESGDVRALAAAVGRVALK